MENYKELVEIMLPEGLLKAFDYNRNKKNAP